VGGDGGAEAGFFEGLVFVGRSLGVVVVVGAIEIGIAFVRALAGTWEQWGRSETSRK